MGTSGLPDVVVDVTTTFVQTLRATSPGLLRGLYLHGSLCWGEFFPGSDIDFVAVLARRPTISDRRALEQAHDRVHERHPDSTFDGFHCTGDDLRRPSSECPLLPVSYEGKFAGEGTIDVNPVTWHELAERGIPIVGAEPDALNVHLDAAALRRYARDNLDTYWRATAGQLREAPVDRLGADEWVAPWCVLGVARLHHLLATGALTSKSGAGRYVLRDLEARWHPIATEALRAREAPGEPTAYDSRTERGRDVRDFVTWAVEDGMSCDEILT